MLKKWKKLDHVKCYWQGHDAGKAKTPQDMDAVVTRSDSGVKLLGIRSRSWLCHLPAVWILPSLVRGDGYNRPYPIELP